MWRVIFSDMHWRPYIHKHILRFKFNIIIFAIIYKNVFKFEAGLSAYYYYLYIFIKFQTLVSRIFEGKSHYNVL